MTTEIILPALTPTMEEANIVTWLVKEGDVVSAGDVLAEIEADKAVVEIEAAEDGVILQILTPEGAEGVEVDSVIAIMGAEGETLPGHGSDVVKDKTLSADVPTEAKSPASVTAAVASSSRDPDERPLASPLAKKTAANAGIELGAVTGTGPNGRIVQTDVLEFIRDAGSQSRQAPAARATEDLLTVPGDVPKEHERLSNMRKVIARRMQSSKQNVPHFYLTIDIEMDALLALRSELNAGTDAVKLSVNDFLIRAVALALKQVPAANVQYAEDELIYFGRADVSVAVSVDGGLVTPVIRGAENKTLEETSNEVRSLAEGAREGILPPEAYQGGTFTVSNLGMYGIKQFEAIINAPQGGILAVGQCEERAEVRDGKFAVVNMMTATLSCDHRAIDGATGAKFLAQFRQLIQAPEQLLVAQ